MKRAFVTFALGLVGLNGLAYCHARSFTQFAESGTRTPRPEKLGWGTKLRLAFTGATIPRPTNRQTPADWGLAFERHVVEVGSGVTLEAWYVPRANGRPLVLLFHGYAGSKADLLREAKAFHDLGYPSVLVDFRGSGGSSGRSTSLGYHEADEVRAVLEHSRRFPDTGRVLFGSSMGAAAVLRAVAEKGVRPDALVLESPFDRMTTAVARRVAATGVPAFPAVPLLVFWGGVQQGFNAFRHDPVDYASRVDRPTLLLHFPGAPHGSLLKADPQRWKSVVPRFLDALFQ